MRLDVPFFSQRLKACWPGKQLLSQNPFSRSDLSTRKWIFWKQITSADRRLTLASNRNGAAADAAACAPRAGGEWVDSFSYPPSPEQQIAYLLDQLELSAAPLDCRNELIAVYDT